MSELRPCRACGAPCSVQMFSHPEKGIEATLWMCSTHRSLGGVCPNETAYLSAGAWNERATPTQDTITARLEELMAKAKLRPLSIPGDPAWSQEQAEYEATQKALAQRAVSALPALLSERATLKAELEEARGVLEPFAEIARKAPADATDDDFAAIKFAHLRAARAYLTKEPNNGR